MYEKHTKNHLKRDSNICSSKILYGFVNVNLLGINIISNSVLGERWSKKYAMLTFLTGFLFTEVLVFMVFL